jgi:putative YhgA-like transposase
VPEPPDPASQPLELPFIREFDDRSSLWLFEDPRNLHDLIRLLDPALADRLDFTRAERQNRSFIDPDLREKESDLLYSVPFRDDVPEGGSAEEVWVYMLVENKSQPQRRAVLTLLGYMLKIWEREADEWENKQMPPEEQWLHPIIPLVYYTGERRWQAPTDLASLFQLPQALARGFVPNFAPLLLSLRDCSPEQLTKQATAIGYALRVWQAEGAPTAAFAAVLREALAGLESLTKEQEALWTRAVWFLMLFVYHRRGEGHLQGAIIEQVRQSHFSEKERVATMGLSIAQQLEARGEARAMRSSLEAFLAARFGPLPETVRQAIAAASPETVSGWIPRAATAATLAEVGILGSPPPG